MIVASELRDDDEPNIALEWMSVFDHNLDTNLTSLFFFYNCFPLLLVAADLCELTPA